MIVTIFEIVIMNSEHEYHDDMCRLVKLVVSSEIVRMREEFSHQLEKERKEKEELWEVIGVLRDELNRIEKQNRIEHTLVAKSILELRDMIDKSVSICIGRTRDTNRNVLVPKDVMEATLDEIEEVHRGELFTGLRLKGISTDNIYELMSLKRIKGLKKVIMNNGYRFENNGVEIESKREVANILKEMGIEVYFTVKKDNGTSEYLRW